MSLKGVYIMFYSNRESGCALLRSVLSTYPDGTSGEVVFAAICTQIPRREAQPERIVKAVEREGEKAKLLYTKYES